MDVIKSQRKGALLHDGLSGGPQGVGDPQDTRLRNVEKEVLIPKLMREIASKEKCNPEVLAFGECCKDSGLFMVYNCRSQNTTMKKCLEEWFNNEDFKNDCTARYLRDRSEYRRLGKDKPVYEQVI